MYRVTETEDIVQLKAMLDTTQSQYFMYGYEHAKTAMKLNLLSVQSFHSR